jgi:hypothetical protein
MRTSYPIPAFSDQYTFKLVDSTFIHAVHLAKSKGAWNYSIGITLQNEQDTIYWYIVKDPQGLYKKLTDPKKSPGFTYNNSIKGKQYSKQYIKREDLGKLTLEAYWDSKQSKSKPIQKVMPVVEKPENPQSNSKPIAKPENPPKVEYVSSYGPLLDVTRKQSSCIAYLALGFNKNTKGFVIYFALKNNIHNMYALETDDAGIYRNWINSLSLGSHYNKVIRKLKTILLKTIVTPSNAPGGPCA